MPRERSGRGGSGRRGRFVDPPATSVGELASWFAGNIPDGWFTEPPVVEFDRDEIIVTGDLAVPKVAADGDVKTASDARIDAFREDTREHRMEIADRAQARFLRRVSWAATCGDASRAFTTASVPVMTRLRLHDRAVLDTLIDAGVARSRSDALAWTVRLVADNEAEWIDQLREAMQDVEQLRDQGPESRRS